MKEALVSVIIPTYNRADLILRALSSVQSQTLKNFEVIVVDDGSNDDTSEKLSNFSHPIRYISLKHSGLPATARNAGLEVANGEYIALLDSDDDWLPEKLEKQVAIFERNPEIGLVSSNAFHRKMDNDSGQVYLPIDEVIKGNVLAQLIQENFIITSTVLIRRKILEKTGGFSENPKLRAVEDYDLWLRIASIAPLYYLPEGLANYWDFGMSIRADIKLRCHYQSQLLILKRLKKFLHELKYREKDAYEAIELKTYQYQKLLFKDYKDSGLYLPAMTNLMKLFLFHWNKLLLAYSNRKRTFLKNHLISL